ncbi:MAG: hypothetical protein JNM64_09470 [Chloroflexia bacterium]|nr:hypothetical protein [Chloroflexia bacterium]
MTEPAPDPSTAAGKAQATSRRATRACTEAQRIALEVFGKSSTKRAAARRLGICVETLRTVCTAPERCTRKTIRKVLAAARPLPAVGASGLPVAIAPSSSLRASLHRAEVIAGRTRDPSVARRILTAVNDARRAGDNPNLAPLAAALDAVPGCGHVCPDEEWHLERLTDRLQCVHCGGDKALGAAPAVCECLTCGRGLSADRTVVAETTSRRGQGRHGGAHGP